MPDYADGTSLWIYACGHSTDSKPAGTLPPRCPDCERAALAAAPPSDD
jgi:hypothetical protein